MAFFPRLRILTLVAALTAPLPGFAGPPACTCQNLESLQQDYQNAVFLERKKRALAAYLKAQEDRLAGLKVTSNQDPDNDLDITATVGNLKVKFEKDYGEMPFPQVAGYSGPDTVDMPFGTCEQNRDDLAALEKGSPCAAMADAALLHELGHSNLCTAIGAKAYWSRPASALALEEAGFYKEQAANLKSELRNVLEDAKVELRGTWRHTLSGQGLTVTYFYETQTGDIGKASGGDTWTMTGKGETATSIESMKLPGMSCTSQGAVRNSMDVVLTTDGLTFGLESRESRVAGEIVTQCGDGGGGTLPTTDTGSGELTSGQALVAGDNPLPYGWATTIKLLMRMGGMEMTGDPDMVLSVTCPAP